MEETFVNPFNETIKNNEDGDGIFNKYVASEDKRQPNEIISLDEFIDICPQSEELQKEMRERYKVRHSFKQWEKLVKQCSERIERLKNRSDADIPDIEYYIMFKRLGDDAASLFVRYLNARKEQTVTVKDKDLQDYIIIVIRDILDEYIGVSHSVDEEAYIEIFKLKKEEFEANRFEIFKDVKTKVVEHFEDLGYTLSERNLKSINWWISHYKVNFTKVN